MPAIPFVHAKSVAAPSPVVADLTVGYFVGKLIPEASRRCASGLHRSEAVKLSPKVLQLTSHPSRWSASGPRRRRCSSELVAAVSVSGAYRNLAAVFQRLGNARRPTISKDPCDPSDRFNRQLVSQTIWLLECAKAIEDGECLVERHRGLHVAACQPLGATQCP